MADSLPAIVVGAGISGLVCAHALRDAGVDGLVIEASSRVGGIIQSAKQDGYLLEFGPQSFSATAPVQQLCEKLAIEGQLVQAPAGAPRFVLLNGALRAVPLSPPAFFSSGFVGFGTKWAILRDALGRSVPPVDDESIANFARRKFSAEMLERLIGPFVSGIYAGDPEKLSLRAAFPQLYEAEVSAGSVVRGVARAGKRSRAAGQGRPALLSFREGNETLPKVLAERLGAALRLGARVTNVKAAATSSQFLVSVAEGGNDQILQTRNLILATPTDTAATLLATISDDFSAPLHGIEYAPVAVVSLGYQQSAIGRSLEGFGFLVPRSAGLQVLGSVWNSSLFANRAPGGHTLFTSFVGGATNPAAARLSPDQLADLVHREISPILGITQPPAFSHATVYERAIPQYNLGHTRRMQALEAARANVPGLFLAGNYLRGPAIGACVEQAQKAAAEVIRKLNS